MSILTPIPPHTPRLQRVALSIPLVGWFARDVLFGDEDNIYYLLVILMTLLILSVMTWGLPALVMTALGMVPVCFTMIFIMSRP